MTIKALLCVMGHVVIGDICNYLLLPITVLFALSKYLAGHVFLPGAVMQTFILESSGSSMALPG